MRCDAGVKICLAVKEAVEKFPEFENEIRSYYPNHRKLVNGSYQDTIDIFQKIKSYGFPCYVLIIGLMRLTRVWRKSIFLKRIR